MKMKKIAAASLAVCVCALSGMSALADTASVVTTTNYRYDGTEPVQVVSTVSNVAAGKQVTYLVWDGTNIKYIDQAEATDGTATFTFTANKADLYTNNLDVFAKFGTDDGTLTGLPAKFEFKDGTNFLTNGVAGTAGVAADVKTALETDYNGKKVYVYTVSGNVTEYGVKVTADGKYEEFPALGAVVNAAKTAATYCVVFENLPQGAVVTPYAR